MNTKYIKIKLQGGAGYIQPVEELANAIYGELDGLDIGETAVIEFTPVDLTKLEYERLPEFTGH